MSNQTPFAVYQGAWSVLERDFEREIIPMARAEGMALAPWNVLAGGKIRSDVEEQRRRETGEKGACRSPGFLVRGAVANRTTHSTGRTAFNPDWERNEIERKVASVLEKVATQVGAPNIQAGTYVAAASRNIADEGVRQSRLRICCRRRRTSSPS